ncbi:MAG TPA: hypothetical protein VFU94_11570 [Conexibacter sp.]|nr:hypothetical protein [Conexibacter sp.]
MADELPQTAGERRRRRTIALAIGFALVAACFVATLSGPAKRRLGTNDVPAEARVALPGVARPLCQGGERIPSGTSAIRIGLGGDERVPPRLALTLSGGGAVRDVGGPGARWDGANALVPLAHPLRGDLDGSLCVQVPPEAGYVLRGALASASEAAAAGRLGLPIRAHVEYLPAGGGAWWSFLPTIARRMGLGHVWSGASVPLLVVVLMLASIALGAWQLVRSDG